MTLEFKDIKGFEGFYGISKTGDVYSYYRNRRIKSYKNKDGYLHMILSVNGKKHNKLIHRLVAETFIPNPNNLPEVNHIDGDKQNNRIENLEWCNGKQNVEHAYRLGLKKPMYGEMNGMYGKTHSDEVKRKLHEIRQGSKLSEETRQKIIQHHIRKQIICVNDGFVYDSIKTASEHYGLDSKRVCDVCKGRLKAIKGYVFKYYRQERGEVNAHS